MYLIYLTLYHSVPEGAMVFFNRTAKQTNFFLNDDSSRKKRKNIDNQLFALYKEGLFYRCYNEDAMVVAKTLQIL
jgi:hypothetical protein